MMLASFVVALAYYGYRYPFQYNVSGYGNVYKDTPPLLSAGKYAIHLGLLAAMIGLLAASGRRLVLSRSGLWLFLTAAAVAVMSIINGGYAPSLAVPFIFSLLCAGIVSVVVHSCPSAAHSLVRVVGRISQVFVVICTGANLIQIFLYATTGRLPAHGYPGIVIRFGGYWDDPNQSAMFSALVVISIAALARNLNRRPRRIVVICGVFNVLVSVSYSGYAALGMGLLVVYVWGRAPERAPRDRRIPWPVLLSVAAVTLLALVPIDLSPVNRAAAGKSESAKLRLSIIYRLDGNTFAITDVPDPTATPGRLVDTLVAGDGRVSSETSVVRLLLIGGVVPMLCLGIWLASAWRPALANAGPWALPVVLAFLGGSFFVPFLVIYPMGLFFFAGMEVAGALGRSSPSTPSPVLATTSSRTSEDQP
ncbi:hypothetical protein KSP35_09305 [Aquihabitans sp. G128]|uniref:hypothetical protein n=1 Tax=Aquihabitans sp. G128 TaxID=2849779 RepID=UPI001C221A98|nr:hypothetical protein [Aquihabitans sp. G128]QXC62955.1 hypothetical protein KSP35_09305 [Aquihabitans sp. G128]